MALKIDGKFEGKLAYAFKNGMRNLAFHRLKKRDFILKSKMAELNQNKNSKTNRSTRYSVKILFYLRNK